MIIAERLMTAIQRHLEKEGYLHLKGEGRLIRHYMPSLSWGGEFFCVVRNWETREYFECKTLTEALEKAEEWGLLC